MNRLLSTSIRKQLLLIVVMVALPAMAAIIWSGLQRRGEDIQEAKADTQKLAAIISAEQNYRVAAAEQLLKIIEHLPEVKRHNASSVERLLSDLLKLHTQYSNIFITDVSGKVWASALPAKNTINSSDRRYFKNALKTGKLSSGEYIVSRFTYKFVMPLAYPYKNDQGDIAGVIVLGFDLDYYKHLLSDAELNRGKGYALLDHNGVVLAMGRPVNPKDFIGKQYNEVQFRKMQDGPEEDTVVETGIDGLRRFISYRKLRLETEREPYMYIRAALPVETVISEANRHFLISFGFFTTFLLVALYFAWFIGKRSIADRISLLETASRQMAHGDLRVRVSERVIGGELGGLGRTFDHMAEELYKREREKSKLIEELRESEKRYRILFDQSPDGVLLIDTQGSMVEFNEVAHTMLGYSRAEFATIRISDINLDNADKIQACINRLLRDGKVECEVKYRAKNGGIRNVQVISRVLVLDSRTLFHSIWQDITERKQVEEALRESEEKFSKSFQKSPLLITLSEIETGKLLEVNDKFLEISGFTRDEVIGWTVAEIGWNPAEQRSRIRQRFLEHGRIAEMELILRRKNGKMITCLYSGEEVTIGKKKRMISIALDITERKAAEEKTQQSEAKYRNLFESSMDGIFIIDLDGNFIDVNTTAYTRLGYTKEEMLSLHISKLVHPEFALRTPERMRQIREDGFAVFESAHLRKDGTAMQVEVNSRLTEYQGRMAHYSMIRDISERKKAEASLKLSLSLLKATLESTADGILVVAENGSITDFNEQFVKLWGIPKTIIDLHDDQKALEFVIDQLKNSKQFIDKVRDLYVRPEDTSFDILEFKDGRIFERYSQAQKIDGKTAGRVWSFRDITKRKRAEEAQRESEKRYHILFDQSPDGILLIDADGRILEFNDAAHNQLSYSRAEFARLRLSDLDPAENPEEIQSKIGKILEMGKAAFDVKHRTKQGEIRDVHIINQAMMLSGKPVVHTIWHDITGRKLMETKLRKRREELTKQVEERTAELKTTNAKLLSEIAQREQMEAELLKAQKLESLGILAGGIAHDFNNLLTTVMGNVSLALLDLDEGHPPHKQLIAADRALLRAQELTQQLLTFSKGGAPVKRDVFIGDLLRESSGFALRGSRVRCEFSIPGDLWQIEVDEGQISQVIHNLAINADQAMPEGGTIRVRCENAVFAEGAVPGLSSGRYVKVMVEDSGVGIPKEHLTKIFDPYFTTKQRGSGLGLATSYSIMRKHGGYISVASELGAGATFTLYLPAFSGVNIAEKRDAATQLSPGSGTILVMDDEEGVRQTAGSALARFGYTAIFAENGSQAIELYQAAMEAGKPYDAVILDLTIPGGMGGKETLRHLREIDPAVKAIVSSGYSNDPIMADYRSYGFAGVVAKPYRIKGLVETVSQVIAASGSGKATDAAASKE